jgi:DNA-binding transcriptional LysR family regulator
LDFEPRTIRSFVALAELLSFTKAAEQLGVTQPQLSSRIKSLELQLGFALFSRTSRRVEITPGGDQFLQAARNFLREAHALERAGQSVRSGRATRIRIGAGNCHADIRWRLLGQFMRRHPHIEVSVQHYPTASQIGAALRSGEVDAALVVPPVLDEFDALRLSRASAGLIMQRDCPLARQATAPPTALAGQQLAIFPRAVFPALHDAVVNHFKTFGAWFTELPETGAACVSSFVRATGVPAVAAPWWSGEQDRPSDIVCRFVDGHPIALDSMLVRSRARSSDAVALLWRLAAKLDMGEAVGDPAYASAPALLRSRDPACGRAEARAATAS